jgi:hypothetical protein
MKIFPINGAPVEWNWPCSCVTLSTTNPTWTDPRSDTGQRGGRPATNRLSHGTAHDSVLLTSCIVKTLQDCLLYLFRRIYSVSANWSSRLTNHFAPECFQSNRTPGPASGNGLRKRLPAPLFSTYRNKRPLKWRYKIWSHVYPPTYLSIHQEQ